MNFLNKKGFTLVELLAVILVLAIISLIAVPGVTEIISEVKEKTFLANAEVYVKTAHEAILEYKIGDEERFYPETCIVSGNTLTCGDIKIKVRAKGTMPDSGTIVYENEEIVKVELKYDGKIIVSDSKGVLVYEGSEEENTLATLCTLAEGSTANTIGAKYTCDFGAGERNFYVLKPGTEESEVSLILEGNYDTTTQYWCDQNGANPSNNVCAADGLTAKLDEIASAWTKLERDQIGIPSASDIVVGDGQSEDAYLNEPSLSNEWLYSWDNDVWGYMACGYWTSSPDVDYSDYALYVSYDGEVHYDQVFNNGCSGVRPVITLKL